MSNLLLCELCPLKAFSIAGALWAFIAYIRLAWAVKQTTKRHKDTKEK